MTTIKNIIFDLGNVIINYDQEKIIEYFTKNKDEHDYIFEQIFKSKEWKTMDLGTLSNIEAGNIIKQRNGFRYKELTENFLNNWYEAQNINEDIVDIAKKLYDKGFKLYVLSNMTCVAFDYFKNHDFFKICDGIVISAQEHAKKPDKKIFEILLNRYKLQPKESLFIDDDDTGRNYETARELGILGRAVMPNNSKDIEQLLRDYNIMYR